MISQQKSRTSSNGDGITVREIGEIPASVKAEMMNEEKNKKMIDILRKRDKERSLRRLEILRAQYSKTKDPS